MKENSLFEINLLSMSILELPLRKQRIRFLLPIQYPIRTVYSDTAIQLTDYSLLAGSGLNFTLPTSVGNRGTAFNVKNISTGTVVVSGIGSQTIDGQTSVEISTQYQSMTFQSDNSNWVIV